MRTVLTALALVVATGGLNAAEQVPKFKQNTLYPDARASLLKLGWQPVPVPAASKRCDQHQNICEAYPEAESCEPIGVVTCSMLWMHGEEIIRVSTISDNNIMVLPGVATLVGGAGAGVGALASKAAMGGLKLAASSAGRQADIARNQQLAQAVTMSPGDQLDALLTAIQRRGQMMQQVGAAGNAVRIGTQAATISQADRARPYLPAAFPVLPAFSR